jgi:RHS repeat-associated protein
LARVKQRLDPFVSDPFVFYPNSTGVQFAYDSRNRLVEKLTFPGNRETFFQYDAKGQLIAEQDDNGNIGVREYDALGRVTAVVDAEGYATENLYDGVGNLVQVTDANGNAQQFAFDGMNRKIQDIDALGNTTTYIYSPTGKLLEKQQPNGAAITYSYDRRDRLLEEKASDGTFKRFAYDNVGRKTSIANDATEEQRLYDARGQLITTMDKFMGRIDYSYDLVGNRVRMIDPDYGVYSYAYDRANHLITFTDPEGGKTRYEYDNMGRVTLTSSPNSTETVNEYNQDNRIASIVSYSDKAEALSSFAYTYDGIGNKLSMTDENGDITSYRYDKLYRLIEVDYPVIAGSVSNGNNGKNKGSDKGKGKKNGHKKEDSPSSPPSYVGYSYDPVGNRQSMTDDQQTVYYQYNEANQLLQEGDTVYSYDANGNRIAKSDQTGQARYSYNANNFLVEFTSPDGESIGYGYDGSNRRAFKNKGAVIMESYLYDGTDVLQEVSGPNNQKITAYYRAGGRIITQQKYNISQDNEGEYQHRPEGRRLYYTYDALGSVASLSNHKGKQETRYVYDVFGEVLAGDLTDNPYAFTGKRFDAESGLYHFHFRQYDATVGVWTTPDPIGILGGINLYAYVQNNPVNLVDILGLHLGGPEGPGDHGDIGGSESNSDDGSSSEGSADLSNIDIDSLKEALFGEIDFGMFDFKDFDFKDYGDPKKGLEFGFRAALKVVSYALNVVANDIAYAITMTVLSPPAAAASLFDGLWSYHGYLDYESDAKNLSQEISDIRDDVFGDGKKDCN